MADVAEGIEHLVMWVRRQAPTSISTSTVTTLDTLTRFGPLRISDLAEREAISQPGMTSLVNRLELAGQAERVPDPTDGRATLVRITDVGRKVLADRQAARTAALRRHLDGLDESSRRALIAALPAVRILIAPHDDTESQDRA
ncbi:MAG: MarR family transcriptional regulator [Jatrophihabitans sp.]|nr:MAG: MarR family transcriptional regulator [Jatrophihabitans sp.]